MPFDAQWIEGDVIMRRLIALRERFADPNRWCKGEAIARAPDGGFSYCLVTAAIELGHGTAGYVARVAYRRGFRGPATFNDHPSTTHADLLSLIEEAIADRVGEMKEGE